MQATANNPAVASHVWLPLLGGVFAALLFQFTALDMWVADHFYHQGQFIGNGNRLAERILHKGGRDAIALVALSVLLLWLCSWRCRRLQATRQPLLYLLLCMAAGTGLVALLKQLSNVDCPWDLVRYGGELPYVHLFSDRPDLLPRGQCFPGGHSSGAFSLFGFYFVARRYRPALAVPVLLAVCLLGSIFALGQWSRGAHFLSHDLFSALICWLAACGLDRLCWRTPARVSSTA